ncbi:MAG: hypothetical protein CMK59_07960 [Proteobacteria bacterium]|nr:hypothetical protein [Pseudomonadota bacterium]
MTLLYLACFAAALVSGVTGMAGGTLLLSVLLLFYDPILSIAVHGLLQVVANCARVLIFLSSVSWTHTLWFVVLVVPGAFLGGKIAHMFNPDLLKMMLSVLILWVAWKSVSKKEHALLPPQIMLGLGFASGFLGMIIGVTGPFLAPFFLRSGLLKEAFIATKAVCQFFVQMAKVAIFAALLGVNYGEMSFELFVMSAVLIFGTVCAKMLLKHISGDRFKQVVSIVLSLIAGRLLWSSAGGYFGF